MAKTTVRKKPIRKSTPSKSGFWTKFTIISLILFALLFAVYHYRNAILYYFSFKSDKVKMDKLDGARIYQVLKRHEDNVVGFDVSEYQGEIEWSKVDSIEKHKIHYVFIRATAGSDKVDSKFRENWKKAQKSNLICGAYHYYRPNENSIEQARNFVNTVKLKKGNLPPVLDIEKLPENQSIDSLKIGLRRWLEYVEKHYRIKPIIYSGERYYQDFLEDEFEDDYTFWIANYNPWKETMDDEWLFWQFTEKAVIEGVNQKVDVNIYNGTPKMLQYLTIN